MRRILRGKRELIGRSIDATTYENGGNLIALVVASVDPLTIVSLFVFKPIYPGIFGITGRGVLAAQGTTITVPKVVVRILFAASPCQHDDQW
jgi:hypothetical protein